MIVRLVRLAVAACLLFAWWTAFNQYNARQTRAYIEGIDGILGALWWDPTRGKYYAKAGRFFLDDPEEMNIPLAIRYLERAIELNPYRRSDRRRLAQAYERASLTAAPDDRADLIRRAEEQFVAAVNMQGVNHYYRWALANFYFRQGRPDDGVGHMRQALDEEPDYMESALPLLIRSGRRLPEFGPAWPSDTVSGMRLLELAGEWRSAGRRGIEHRQVVALWDRLMEADPPPSVEAGTVFVGHLLDAGRHAEARAAWVTLAGRNGLIDAAYADGTNRVWNGAFENLLVESRLSWYTWPGEGFEITRAAGEGVAGSGALRIDFDGEHNASLANLQQLVLLEPGQTYELSFKAKAAGVTTDKGPRLEVFDPRARHVLYHSDDVVGTTDWATHSGTFTVPDDCGSAMVRAVRLPSGRIANRIGGTLWLDEVSLRPSSASSSLGATARESAARR